jgi:hypothetical protein
MKKYIKDETGKIVTTAIELTAFSAEEICEHFKISKSNLYRWMGDNYYLERKKHKRKHKNKNRYRSKYTYKYFIETQERK